MNTGLDHVCYHVTDVHATAAALERGYGFTVYAERTDSSATSVCVGRDRVRLVLTQAHAEDHPAAVYTTRHGDGIADIALSVPDAAAAFEHAVARGARPIAGPASADGVTTAAIEGFGDVVHTFVERSADVDGRHLPGFTARPGTGAGAGMGLSEVDHLAVCLEAGTLKDTVEFYRQVLGFHVVFAERILVGTQAMNSEVVRNSAGDVTLTLIEPDTDLDPGQIDTFLKDHGGSGVQHIAFASADIVRSVTLMRDADVEFLTTPESYYRALPARLPASRHDVDTLNALNILGDEDHAGQLFQIFTRSVHPRATLFFEVIERAGAQLFGSGNIKALYEAVDRVGE
nr:4-hydroxyphenylpyruvate dioxygenase [Kibdelosporangium sp. MJ126-NF4]CEL16419.1 4-hydroxyphenylpyruvate dioxygenase [Kibdelosporangium sp. MJ126-NF4]CTQ90371.1 4-hydroxyphenylpyruvate dioxygenase (EC 1.13.11.27) [Kibdelosporangium sp. MJ126-NF4]